MDPLTITTLTFEVEGPNGLLLIGTVAVDATNKIATFTPASDLAVGTTFTATITSGVNGVKDVAGNALASDFVWSFTTGAQAAPGPVDLRSVASFGGCGGGAGMTNQGLLTVINGDILTTGASTLITGFHDGVGPDHVFTETPLNAGLVNGTIFTAPPPPGTVAREIIAAQALADANAAYIAISPAAMPGGIDLGDGELGGRTLPPGVYKSVPGTYAITLVDLTLDGQGDANAVWVFQMASSLTVGSPAGARSVHLINGAQAQNVFWQVGSAATINGAGGGTMVGTIIAQAGVTFDRRQRRYRDAERPSPGPDGLGYAREHRHQRASPLRHETVGLKAGPARGGRTRVRLPFHMTVRVSSKRGHHVRRRTSSTS